MVSTPVLVAETPRIWAVTPEKIDEAVRRLVDVADPVCIILFGSQARGDPSDDSDADLLVVERSVTDRYMELARLRRALKGLLMPVDLLLIDDARFQELKHLPGSVYRQAWREGKVLHGAF